MSSNSRDICRSAGSASILFLLFVLPVLFLFLTFISELMWYTELQARDQATVDAVTLRASRHLPNIPAAEAAIVEELPEHLKYLTIRSDQSKSSIAVFGTLSTPTLFSRLLIDSSLASVNRFVATTVRIPPLAAYVAIDTSAYMAPADTEEARIIDTPPAAYFDQHKKDATLLSAHCFNPSFITLKRSAISILRSLEGINVYRSATGTFGGGIPNNLQTINTPAPNSSADGAYNYGFGLSSYKPIRSEDCAHAAETEMTVDAFKMPEVWHFTNSGPTTVTRSGPLIDPDTMTVIGPDTVHMEESVWSLVASDSGRPNYAQVIQEVIFNLLDQVGDLQHTVGQRRDLVGVVLAGGSPLDTDAATFENELTDVAAEIDRMIGSRSLHISIVYVYHPSRWNHAHSSGEALATVLSQVSQTQEHIKFSVMYAPNEQTLSSNILPLITNLRKPAVIAR